MRVVIAWAGLGILARVATLYGELERVNRMVLGPLKSGFRATPVLACALVALAGCATEPAERFFQPDAAPLPRFETARTRADHEEIVTWYEREAASADPRDAEAHLALARLHRRWAEEVVE